MTLRLCVLGCFLCTIITLLLLTWSALSLQRSITLPDYPNNKILGCIQRDHDHTNTARTIKSKPSCSAGYVLHAGTCTPCSPGKFSLDNWIACQPLLGCEQIQHEILQKDLLHSLVHWHYFKADWKGYEVIYATFNTLAKTSVDYDTMHLLPLSPNILYPIGFCKDTGIVIFASNKTFLEPGNQVETLFKSVPQCDSCEVRLHLAISYIRVLTALHESDTVLCNSRTLPHLLSQLLVSDHFSFVLSAVDNLPRDADGPVLCCHRELTGKFVAPEQKWPFGSMKIFNSNEQPRYGKESDVWKVPAVVDSLLGSSCEQVLDYLQGIHLKCKNMSPQERPSAREILEDYEYVWNMFVIA